MGFIDLYYLLPYVTVVCGGDIDMMITTCSKLIWLDEWILYFEYIYGHSKNRWIDYECE